MQTDLWRLRKFWEIFGVGWCFQETWHSGLVGGCSEFFLLQWHSSLVSPWLSPAGKHPSLNAKQKVTFFFPNLKCWPVNLKILPLLQPLSKCHLTLLNPVDELTSQAWGSATVTRFMPCRMATWMWWGWCGHCPGLSNVAILASPLWMLTQLLCWFHRVYMSCAPSM